MNPFRALANIFSGLARLAIAPNSATYSSRVVDLSASSDFWFAELSPDVKSGIEVTDARALTYSAVWAATRLLSSTIGLLPLDMYRRVKGGGREVALNDRREYIVHDRPNGDMTAMMFRTQASQQQVNAGNCYSLIRRNAFGDITALDPIHHTRVSVIRDEETESLIYEVRNSRESPTYVKAADILHVPSMMSEDGITGKGVIRAARESIGFGIATEQYGASWFGGGAQPRIMIETPKQMQPDARDNLRKEWRETYGGSDGSKVGILTAGMTAKTLNISAEDQQYLETRQHNVEEIARWYGVPPHMIQQLLRATFSNIEEQGIEFVIYSLMPWLKLWEQELNAKLLTPDEHETMYFEFNVNALLRGNAAARGAFYQSGITTGWLTPNQVCEFENLNPYPEGNQHFMQGAMMPVGMLGAATLTTDMQPADVPPVDAAATDVQATALNGAQIIALVDIANRLATEQLPPEGTRALIEAAFPAMDRKLIQTIVSELDKFIPTPVEPPPSPFGASPSAPPADEMNGQPADPPQSPPSANGSPRERMLIGSAQTTLTRAIGYIMRRDAHEARKAAKKPREFNAWLDRYFDDEYRYTFSEAIGPSCKALQALGYAADTVTTSESQANQSRQELFALTGSCTYETLCHGVNSCVSTWEEKRPMEAVAEIMRTEITLEEKL